MYRIDKDGEAIRTLQRNLILLERGTFSVIPTGIYDRETELAIREFQEQNAFPITGITDYLTFEAVYERGKADEEERERKKKYRGTNFPIKEGDGGISVYNLNVMLSEILSYYGLYYFTDPGSIYDRKTREAVDTVARLFGYGETREVDSRLYERIELEYLSIK